MSLIAGSLTALQPQDSPAAAGDAVVGVEPTIAAMAPVGVVSDAQGSAEVPGPRLMRYVPQVVLATLVVTGAPLAIVAGLRGAGLIQSVPMSIVVGTVLSLAVSWGGNLFWRKRPGSGDILFGELMVWGWLRRLWIERQLKSTAWLLGGVGSSAVLSVEQRTELLTRLAGALEARDAYTHGHSRRVARSAAMIAGRLGLSASEAAKIRTAAILHDVGKVNTPLAVLHKPGRLTDEEFDVIKRHPVDGAAMVSTLSDDELTAMVRHHHERLDGTGYPDRLKGDQIPLGARIIAVADTFDAITSVRPYRGASPHKKAIDILTAEAGKQLDPAVVRAFDSCYAGRRSLALWASLINAAERLAAWLSGGLTAASAGSIAPMVAAAALTGVAAGATLTPPRSEPSRAQHGRRVAVRARGTDRHVVVAVSPSSLTTKAPAEGRRGKHSHGRSRSVTRRGGGSIGGRHGASGVGVGPTGAGRGTTQPPQSGAGLDNTGPTGSGTGTSGSSGNTRLNVSGPSVSTGSSGPTVNAAGTSVSTGDGGTSIKVGETNVSAGTSGPSVNAGGTSASTDSSGTSINTGGTTVSSGSGGPGVSVGGLKAGG